MDLLSHRNHYNTLKQKYKIYNKTFTWKVIAGMEFKQSMTGLLVTADSSPSNGIVCSAQIMTIDQHTPDPGLSRLQNEFTDVAV